MNQQQTEFIQRAIAELRQVIATSAENGGSASAKLGRKQLGKHVIVVSIIAEVDNGFAAPLSSHASTLGDAPVYPTNTRHHHKHRAARWHKPIF